MDDNSDVVVLWTSLEPSSPVDAQRLDLALQRLTSEDKHLRVRMGEAGQIIIAGVSEAHLERVIDRLAREFNVAASVGKAQVAYKEALTVAAEGNGRFVRQTGGRGQYGHVRIRVVPLSPGSGYEFRNQVVGGAVPERYMGAICEGIEHALAHGIIAGCPVDDVRIEVIDGSYHETDSSDAAFKIAGALAFADAAHKARPILTEPIMRMEVRVPDQYLEQVSADLRKRNANIEVEAAHGAMHLVRTGVRLRHFLGYDAQLNYLTAGRASHSLQYDRYEPVEPGPRDEPPFTSSPAHRPRP